MSETDDLITNIRNKQKNIIEWFNSFVDCKYETQFTDLITSSAYTEYVELEQLHKTWVDIETKILDEEKQDYPDKYLISRLSYKTKEWISKFQNIYSLYEHVQKLKNKIWDQFCKNFSEEFENHSISIRNFPDFIFNHSKCTYIIFKKILVAKICYLSKTKEEIIVDKREEFLNNNNNLSKLGEYRVVLPYGNWPREN